MSILNQQKPGQTNVKWVELEGTEFKQFIQGNVKKKM